MCVQVTKTANRFEISSLLEKILLKQVRWCLTFVGLYTCILKNTEGAILMNNTGSSESLVQLILEPEEQKAVTCNNWSSQCLNTIFGGKCPERLSELLYVVNVLKDSQSYYML